MRLKIRSIFVSLNLGNPKVRTFLATLAIAAIGLGPLAQTVRADTASLTINGGTTGTFTYGQTWTVNLSSDFPNTSFTLCSSESGQQNQNCIANQGTTDANGNWTSSALLRSRCLREHGLSGLNFLRDSNRISSHIPSKRHRLSSAPARPLRRPLPVRLRPFRLP